MESIIDPVHFWTTFFSRHICIERQLLDKYPKFELISNEYLSRKIC